MLQSRVGFSIVLISIVICLFISTTNSLVVVAEIEENDTPIVGILTQEISRFTLRNYPDRNFTSYLAASYVKFVEGSGARAVPIWIGQPPEYYKDIVSKVNGVLLPGGATHFNQSKGYADAGYHIYQAAIELNEQGTYFPIWGTCLGFELLAYLDFNRTDHRSQCNSQKQPLPLEFTEEYKTSRMFGKAPEDVISIFKKYPVTANFHIYCITNETFKKYGLDENWKILSVNHDWNNFEFISSIEHKKYPFYGVQYHPEKNLYEFIENRGIPHSMEGIRAATYFSEFFIKETRKNMNKFDDKKEEQLSLIYNWVPEYTGVKGSSFIQQYLFEAKSIASMSACSIITIIASMAVMWFSNKSH